MWESGLPQIRFCGRQVLCTVMVGAVFLGVGVRQETAVWHHASASVEPPSYSGNRRLSDGLLRSYKLPADTMG
ncbi:unnamed protein product [Lota lota]